MYNQTATDQVGVALQSLRPAEGSQAAGECNAMTTRSNSDVCRSMNGHHAVLERGSLGIFTKSPVILTNKGVQRIHEFLLQDQSAKLLPLERVCNCLKTNRQKTAADSQI